MKTFKQVQNLPIDINSAWSFFSNPRNLKEITPSYMGFKIIGEMPEKIYPGMILQYKVKPIFNIPMMWVTEITQMNEPNFFVDDQKTGPFKFWHHQHIFRETTTGTEMTDIVNYEVPFGWIGRIAGKCFVEPRVKEIFEFRSKKILEIFPNKYFDYI